MPIQAYFNDFTKVKQIIHKTKQRKDYFVFKTFNFDIKKHRTKHSNYVQLLFTYANINLQTYTYLKLKDNLFTYNAGC